MSTTQRVHKFTNMGCDQGVDWQITHIARGFIARHGPVTPANLTQYWLQVLSFFSSKLGDISQDLDEYLWVKYEEIAKEKCDVIMEWYHEYNT